MEYRLLGPLEVRRNGRPVPIGAGKRRALLAILLLRANEVVPAERLIDELWGERPPATAAKALQVHVSQLRKELGTREAEALRTRANGYVLQIDGGDLDVARFEDGVATGESLLAAGEPERAATVLGAALALWHGPPLADFAYEPFAQPEIARLEDLRLAALERRIDADLALGRHAHVVGELEALVARHPFREGIRAAWMLALYRSDRQAEALEAYRDGHRLMTEEMGIEPGPALRDLQARILAQEPDLAAPRARPEGAPSPRPAPSPAGGEEVGGRAAGEAVTGTPAAQRSAMRRRVPVAIAGALVIVAVAAVALGDGSPAGGGAPVLDLAANSLVGLGRVSKRPAFVLPLPGRPTDVAAGLGLAVTVTVDAPALVVADARSRSIVRTVPLATPPAAVALGGGGVWVADTGRGIVMRFDRGYAQASARIRYGPGTAAAATESSPESTGLAATADAVWLTDGSRRLLRIDPGTGAVRAVRAPVSLDGVTARGRSVWAYSRRGASVVRVDPARAAVTDVIPLARRGSDAPAPIGIATTPGAVWVLSGNTATLTRIDTGLRGVTATVPVGVDRLPQAITASGDQVWVAGLDGSLSRVGPSARTGDSRQVGEALSAVAADREQLWVTVAPVDRQLPGGAG